VGRSGARARGEHLRRIASGRESNKTGESSDIMIGGP